MKFYWAHDISEKWLMRFCALWHHTNKLGPEQYGHWFADKLFNGIFLTENVFILIEI